MNEPLYIITYCNTAGNGANLDQKIIHLQTEKQYQSWLNNSYATAQGKYDVILVQKRNDVPPKEGREYNRYKRIYPNEW